jgi:hypothetical protein
MENKHCGSGIIKGKQPAVYEKADLIIQKIDEYVKKSGIQLVFIQKISIFGVKKAPILRSFE